MNRRLESQLRCCPAWARVGAALAIGSVCILIFKSTAKGEGEPLKGVDPAGSGLPTSSQESGAVDRSNALSDRMFLRGTGRLAISPPNHIVDLAAVRRTYSYRLMNIGSETVHLSVEPFEWKFDEKNEITVLPDRDEGVHHWILIMPRELEIPPGESRVVRFSVQPDREVPPGEYVAGIAFVQQHRDDASAQAPGLSFRSQFRIQSGVYIVSGRVRREGRILGIEIRPDQLRTLIASRGNGHVRLCGRFLVWSVSGAQRDGLDGQGISAPPARGADLEVGASEWPVLAGDERWISHPFSGHRMSPGAYIIQFIGVLGDQKISEIFRAELPHEVP